MNLFLSRICRKYQRLAEAAEGVQSESDNIKLEELFKSSISRVDMVSPLLCHRSCTPTQLTIVRATKKELM
jgi:hypothetical protein